MKIKSIITILFVMFFVDVFPRSPISTGPPRIDDFRAESLRVLAGQRTVISWRISGAEPMQLSITPPRRRRITKNESFTTDALEKATTFTLKATNSQGHVQKSIVVQVTPSRMPTANAGGPYRIETWVENGIRKGTDLNLDGSRSTDPDIAAGDSIERYQWDVTDRDVFNRNGAKISLTYEMLAAEMKKAYPDWETELTRYMNGGRAFTIKLKVTDTTGRSHVALAALYFVAK